MSMEGDLRTYLMNAVAPLMESFLMEVSVTRPVDALDALSAFVRRKEAERGRRPSVRSNDTERLMAEPSELMPERASQCSSCDKYRRLFSQLRHHFLAVAYEVLQLAQVPPWHLSDAVKRARKRTITVCRDLSRTPSHAEPNSNSAAIVKTRGAPSTSSSCTSDDDDLADSLPDIFTKRPQGWRSGVRESVRGESTRDMETFQLPHYHKSNEEAAVLAKNLETCVIFSSITEPAQRRRLIDSMKPMSIPKDFVLLRQGDSGDGMYVIGKGTLRVDRESNGAVRQLRVVGAGEVVGELAVLHHAPRSSTVSAMEACDLWFLDRQSFNLLAREEAKKKRDHFENFLKSVPILEPMGMYARGRLADALKERSYAAGEIVIQEGEVKADAFYIIAEGKAVALRGNTKSRDYTKLDYFGEVALLQGGSRQATVQAVTPLRVVLIDKRVFKRVMADVLEALREGMKSY